MPPPDGWYLTGPLIAVALVGTLAGVMRWTVDQHGDPAGEQDGLTIFDRDDYGLLHPAALAENQELADDVRALLAAAGIRSTCAQRRDGRVVVLVFAEEADEARRLVDDLPAV
jgi:hypothetical protein